MVRFGKLKSTGNPRCIDLSAFHREDSPGRLEPLMLSLRAVGGANGSFRPKVTPAMSMLAELRSCLFGSYSDRVGLVVGLSRHLKRYWFRNPLINIPVE